MRQILQSYLFFSANVFVYSNGNREINLCTTKKNRCGQGSNLRGQSPMDFKSISLTTRSPQLSSYSHKCESEKRYGSAAIYQSRVSNYLYQFVVCRRLQVCNMWKICLATAFCHSCGVRVVKEMDSKSIGLCPRRFESCLQRSFLTTYLPVQRIGLKILYEERVSILQIIYFQIST